MAVINSNQNRNDNKINEFQEKSEKAETREKGLYKVVIGCMILLLLLGSLFFFNRVVTSSRVRQLQANEERRQKQLQKVEAYQEYQEQEEKRKEEESGGSGSGSGGSSTGGSPGSGGANGEEVPGYLIDDGGTNIYTNRLLMLMGILNNPFKEVATDRIGYIYRGTHSDTKTISNDYMIYTALNYLSSRNYTERVDEYYDDDEENTTNLLYNEKVDAYLVEEVIEDIFGDVKINKLAYKGTSVTCPMGYYNEADDYFYIGSDCSIGDVTIKTHDYKIVETPKKIEVYQAKAYFLDNDDEFGVYRDELLTDRVSDSRNYMISAGNYTTFVKYKYTFTKGSDGLFHFSSIDLVG